MKVESSVDTEVVVEEAFLGKSFIPEKYNPFRLLKDLVGNDVRPYVGAVIGLGAGVLVAIMLGGSREVMGLGVGGGAILGFIFGVKAQKDGEVSSNLYDRKYRKF